MLRKIAQLHYSEATTFAIKLAMEEALINAVKHGNRFDLSKKVTANFDIDAEQAVITIADEGDGFDPVAVPDPTTDENLEKPCENIEKHREIFAKTFFTAPY